MTDDLSIGKRYSEDEMRKILAIAMRHDQVIRGSVSESELKSVAAEIGISSEAVGTALAAYELRKVRQPPVAPLPGLIRGSTALGVSIGVVGQLPLLLGSSETAMLLTPVASVVALMISGAAASQRSQLGAKLGFLRFQARNLGIWLGCGGASWFIHTMMLSAPADGVRFMILSALLWTLSSVVGGVIAALRSRAPADTGERTASPALALVQRLTRRISAWLTRISGRPATRSSARAMA